MSDITEDSNDDEELVEFMLDFVDQDENDEVSIQTVSQRGRGRPRIAERWTRVLNVDTADVGNTRTFELRFDLLIVSDLSKDPIPRANKLCKPIFCPR